MANARSDWHGDHYSRHETSTLVTSTLTTTPPHQQHARLAGSERLGTNAGCEGGILITKDSALGSWESICCSTARADIGRNGGRGVGRREAGAYRKDDSAGDNGCVQYQNRGRNKYMSKQP